MNWSLFYCFCVSEMPDDCASIDSESSRLSDINEADTSVDSGHSTCPDSSPKALNAEAENTDKVTPSDTLGVCDEVKPTEEEAIVNSEKMIDKNDIVNEIVVGSGVDASGETSVPALGLQTADKLGLGVDDMVKKCMDDGSEDSRDSTQNEGDELDLTGIDDNEISLVSHIYIPISMIYIGSRISCYLLQTFMKQVKGVLII